MSNTKAANCQLSCLQLLQMAKIVPYLLDVHIILHLPLARNIRELKSWLNLKHFAELLTKSSPESFLCSYAIRFILGISSLYHQSASFSRIYPDFSLSKFEESIHLCRPMQPLSHASSCCSSHFALSNLLVHINHHTLGFQCRVYIFICKKMDYYPGP